MGIPRLMTKLQPYAATITRQRPCLNGYNSQHEGLIIDGPSFAHWIYNLEYGARRHGHLAVEALPPLQALIDLALTWLERFESFGLQIKHIFFDGALPESKLAERFKRIQLSHDGLRLLKSEHPNLDVERADGNCSLPSSLVKRSNSIEHSAQSPAFFIPAILEALLHSKYGAVTSLVPCEADTACTDPRACSEQDFILTSDSDLVVYKPNGRVVYFHDITYSPRNDPPNLTGVLRAKCYDGLTLAQSIGTNDLQAVAYFISQSKTCSLERAVNLANTQQWNESEALELLSFRKAYSNVLEMFPIKSENASLSSVLQRLDPRISEVVQGILSNRAASRRGEDSEIPARIFLANLLEDPSRASAWRPSYDLRFIAYNLLYSALPSYADIQEVDRRGLRIVALPVQLCPLQRCVTEVEAIVSEISSLLGKFGNESGIHVWRAFALRHVLRFQQGISALLPNHGRIIELSKGESTVYLSWPDLHLNAQVEGVLYSLRILDQLINVCRAWTDNVVAEHTGSNEPSFGELSITDEQSDAEILSRLKTRSCVEKLSDFRRILDLWRSPPTLQELMPSTGHALKLGSCDEHIKNYLNHLFHGGHPNGGYSNSESGAKEKKKQHKDEPSEQEAIAPGTGSMDQNNNMYSLLESNTT